MSFDLTRYSEHKLLGLIKVEKDKFICKQYDRFTGQEIDPVSLPITDELIKQLENQRTVAETILRESQAALDDITGGVKEIPNG